MAETKTHPKPARKAKPKAPARKKPAPKKRPTAAKPVEAKAPRTFKLPGAGEKHMRGDDVKNWQTDVKKLFRQMGINCPIVIDGVWAQQSRGMTAALVHAMGLSAAKLMKNGVTPELRIKLRNRDLTKAQLEVKNSKARKEYRDKLRKRWLETKAHAPVSKITTDDWGFQVGGHDGIDVTSIRGAAAFAMVKCKIIDVRTGDWWGASPSGNVSLGDGIVQMEVLENVGPFKKGDRIGYGHLEQPRDNPVVKVGQVVEAGHIVGMVGLAVTPHIHMMMNHGAKDKTRDGRLVGSRGVGTFDPRRCLDYAVKHG